MTHHPHFVSVPVHGLCHSLDGASDSKNKNGMSSLAGSLIQVRVCVHTFAVALYADQDILAVAFPTINGGLSSPAHSPRKGPKSEIGHFSEEDEMLDYMMLQNYTTYSTSSASAPTSPTPISYDSFSNASYQVHKDQTRGNNAPSATLLGTNSTPSSSSSGGVRNNSGTGAGRGGGTGAGTGILLGTGSLGGRGRGGGNGNGRLMNSTTSTFLQQKNGDPDSSSVVSGPQGGIKVPKTTKMIQRAFLFADDPNCIEVFASEGDQALTTYVTYLYYFILWYYGVKQ